MHRNSIARSIAVICIAKPMRPLPVLLDALLPMLFRRLLEGLWLPEAPIGLYMDGRGGTLEAMLCV